MAMRFLYIRDISDPNATTPEDITTTPINVLVINGEPRLTGITGLPSSSGSGGFITFTTTFGTRISGLEADNFRLTRYTSSDTDSNGTVVAPVSVEAVDPVSSLYLTEVGDGTADTGTNNYASMWRIVTPTLTNTVGASFQLDFINTAGIDPEGPEAPLAVPTTGTESLRQSFVATAPTVNPATLLDSPITSGGDIRWTVSFNQPVIGVDANDFAVWASTDGGTTFRAFPVTISIDDPSTSDLSDTAPGDSSYEITAALPQTGNNTNRLLSLRFAGSGALGIRGAFAPQSGNLGTSIRVPFAGRSDNISTTNYEYNTDTTPPVASVANITTSRITDLSTVASWQVRFSEPIDESTLAATDFAVTTDTSSTISSIAITLTDVTTTSVTVNANLSALSSINTGSDIDLHLNISGSIEDATSNNNTVATSRISAGNNYILNTDTAAPAITSVTVTSPTDRFTRGGSSETIVWNIGFDHAVENVASNGSQFAVTTESGTSLVGNVSIGVVETDSQNYVITATLPTSGNDPTRVKLSYASRATGISRVGGNEVAHAPSSDDVESTPTLISFAVGSSSYARITGLPDTTNRTITFRVTFNSRVSGITATNFAMTTHESAGSEVVIPPANITAVSPSTSLYTTGVGGGTADDSSATFASVWQIVSPAVSNTNNGSVRLEIDDITNIDPEGPDTVISALPSDGREFLDQLFVATAPRVSITNNTRDDAEDTLGGDVRWTVHFDQPVVGVGTGDFVVYASTDGGTSYSRFTQARISNIDNDTTTFTDATTGFSQYQITATLPPANFDIDRHLNLRFSGTGSRGIMGSRAPDENDPSQMTREEFAGFADNLITQMPDYRYNTDTSNPTIRSINRIGDERQRVAGDIQWRVIFSESVSGVGTDDFAVMVSDGSLSATSITNVEGNGDTYTLTANVSSATSTTLDRVINLVSAGTVTITDTNGNSNPYVAPSFAVGDILTGSTNRFILNTDTTGPIATLSTSLTNRFTRGGTTGEVSWVLSFNEDVRGVIETTNSNQFSVSSAIRGRTTIEVSETTAKREYLITATLPSSGNNTDTEFQLRYTGSGITDDNAGTSIPNSLGNRNLYVVSGTGDVIDDSITFTLNTDPNRPMVSSVTRTTPSTGFTRGGSITWTITFSTTVEGVNIGTSQQFGLSYDPAPTTPPSTSVTVAGSGSTYTATATLPTTGIEDDTTISLVSLLSFDNTSTPTTPNVIFSPSNQRVYEVASGDMLSTSSQSSYVLNTDSTAPTLTSIAVMTPPADNLSREVVWLATYSEPVRGVSVASFNVSGGARISADDPPSVSNDDDNDGFASQWTFTTIQSGLFGGETQVSGTNIGVASTDDVSPPLRNSILDMGRNPLGATTTSGMHLFTQATVSSITRTTDPSTGVGGDGSSSSTRINANTNTIIWTIVYANLVPVPSSDTYAIDFECAAGVADCSVPFTAEQVDDTTHTVTMTNIPELVAKFTLVEGNSHYGLYNAVSASDREIYIDSQYPRLDATAPGDGFVEPPDFTATTLEWTVTFDESVTGFNVSDNIEVSGTLATPTIDPSSGSGTTFTIRLVPSSTDTNISLGVVQSSDGSGAIDSSGNPIRVGIRSTVRIERTTEAITEYIESSANRYVNSSPSLTSRLSRITPAPRTISSPAPSSPAPAPSGSSSTGSSPSTNTNTEVFNPDDDLSTNFAANVTSDTMDASIGMTMGNHSFAASMNDYGQEFDYSGIYSLDNSRALSWLPSWIFGESYVPSGVEMWVQTSYSVTETDGVSDSSSLFLHTGFDVPLSDESILGVLLQVDSTDQMSAPFTQTGIQGDAHTTLESLGWMFGPYYAVRSGSLNLEARGSIGGSTVEISPFGTYRDEYDTDRLFMTAALSRIFPTRGNKWTLTPRIEYSYFSEDQAEYIDGAQNPTPIPSVEFKLSRVSVGPRLAHNSDLGSGSVMSSSIGFTGTFDTTERTSNNITVKDDIRTGKIDIGLSYRSIHGLSWNLGGYYDVITQDDNVTSYGFTTGFGIRF